MKKITQFYHKNEKMVKKAGVVGVALIALWGGSCLCCHGDKAMVIDFNRAQQEATAYKAIVAEQAKYMEKLQADWSLELGALQKEDQELTAKKKKMKEAEFKKKVAILQGKLDGMQQKYHVKEQQIMAATQLTLEKIKPDVQKAISEAADKAGAGVVVDKNIVLHSAESSDMTDTFIKMMNKYVGAVEYPNPETVNLSIGR